jgi:hypothetical protein
MSDASASASAKNAKQQKRRISGGGMAEAVATFAKMRKDEMADEKEQREEQRTFQLQMQKQQQEFMAQQAQLTSDMLAQTREATKQQMEMFAQLMTTAMKTLAHQAKQNENQN